MPRVPGRECSVLPPQIEASCGQVDASSLRLGSSRLPAGWPPQVKGHHQLLRKAGFVVDVSEETPDWQRRQQALYDGICAAQTALVSELDAIAATDLLTEAQEFPALLKQSRRVLVMASRESSSLMSAIG